MNESERNGISDYICLYHPDLGLEQSSAIFSLRSEFIHPRPLLFHKPRRSYTCSLAEDRIYLVESNALEIYDYEIRKSPTHAPRKVFFPLLKTKQQQQETCVVSIQINCHLLSLERTVRRIPLRHFMEQSLFPLSHRVK